MAESVGIILGSAFHTGLLPGLSWSERTVETPWGRVVLHREAEGGAWLRFRHGLPHTHLPNQINYRAQAWALREVGCTGVITTSSVGVLDPAVPLFTPLLAGDLMMPDNRLPDGSACTLFDTPRPGHGHLVVRDGLFSSALSAQVRGIAAGIGVRIGPSVVFAYVAGPRTKTPAENRMWALLGAQVNSMTVGPEVVLAGELELPCAGLLVGHKRSGGDGAGDMAEIAASLEASRAAMARLIAAIITSYQPVPFANSLYRFS